MLTKSNVDIVSEIESIRLNLLKAESSIESILSSVNPKSYVHDLLATSLTGIAVIMNKIDVAHNITEKNI